MPNIKYLVKFDFSTISRSGEFAGREGEIDVETDMPEQDIYHNKYVKAKIAGDMTAATKSRVCNIVVTSVEPA